MTHMRKSYVIVKLFQFQLGQTTVKQFQVHFEESQFEQNRKDGKRKLKPNAIPTIYGTTEGSRGRVKRKRVPWSDLQDRNDETVSDAEVVLCFMASRSFGHLICLFDM